MFVWLHDNGRFSTFEARLPSVSPFYTFLVYVSDGVMFIALGPQVVSQAPQCLRIYEIHVVAAFGASLSGR